MESEECIKLDKTMKVPEKYCYGNETDICRVKYEMRHELDHLCEQ